MKLKIKEPCHEDWSKMKIGIRSRHCDVCEKSVQDFTQNTRAEIITYMLSNQNQSVCGRLRPDQFDFRHEDVPMLITTMQRQRTVNPFLILSLVCMSLSACAQEEINHIETPPAVEQHYKIGKMVAVPVVIEEEEELGDIAIEEIRMTKGEVMPVEVPKGDISLEETAIESNQTCNSQRVFQYTEKMPEFCGGLSAMSKYFTENVRYNGKPKAQGTVYVRFVVEKDGSITRSEVIRGIHPKLDQEALRAVTEMPDWEPGEQHGEEVPVYMTIPVRFER